MLTASTLVRLALISGLVETDLSRIPASLHESTKGKIHERSGHP